MAEYVFFSPLIFQQAQTRLVYLKQIFLPNSSSQSITKRIYLHKRILNLDIKICPDRPKTLTRVNKFFTPQGSKMQFMRIHTTPPPSKNFPLNTTFIYGQPAKKNVLWVKCKFNVLQLKSSPIKPVELYNTKTACSSDDYKYSLDM